MMNGNEFARWENPEKGRRLNYIFFFLGCVTFFFGLDLVESNEVDFLHASSSPLI